MKTPIKLVFGRFSLKQHLQKDGFKKESLCLELYPLGELEYESQLRRIFF